MSFNIPILFDDSPFSEDDSFFRRQPRNKRGMLERRQPDLFQGWTRPDLMFSDPREELFDRANYRNKPRREVLRPSGVSAQDRRQPEESDEEEVDESEVHNDWDGWDIPVQFVEYPVSGNKHRHRHAKEPQQQPRKNKMHSKADEGQPTKHSETAPAHPVKHVREIMPRMANKKPADQKPESDKQNQEERNKVEQKLPSNDEKSVNSDEDTKANDSGIDIPVQHSFQENTMKETRRRSKRLSQCDPPSLAEIKLARIKSIVEKSDGLEDKIKEFNDPIQNKKFLYLSETLMKLLLDLDKVDSEGIDLVRNARRKGVKTIQNLVEQLENKLAENKKNEVAK